MTRATLPLSVLLVSASLAAEPLPDWAAARFGEVRFQSFTVDARTVFSPDDKRVATGGANNPVGVSRKGVLGQRTGRPDRMAGTLAVSCVALASGSALVFRIRDVAPHRDTVRVRQAVSTHREKP